MRLNKLDAQSGLFSESGPPIVMRQPHYHDHIELNLPEQGAMTYLMGGHQFKVEAGQLLAFWAAVPHQTTGIADDTRLHWLYIPLSQFLEWNLPASFVESMLSGSPLLGSAQSGDLGHFRQWHQDLATEQPEAYAIVLLEAEARLRRLAWRFGLPGSASALTRISGSAHSHPVRQMALYIAEHYTEPLTVEQIAQLVNLHPNYAMKLFRDQLHSSILEYLTRHRVAHAQRLLLTTDTQITDIGMEAGFGSPSRFYAVFKRYCGESPGQYRRRLYAGP